jgi:hypothetical protein
MTYCPICKTQCAWDRAMRLLDDSMKLILPLKSIADAVAMSQTDR